ncbi:Stk1 family PASTA domain-containing Ser/Thr kinase [Lapillicoccus sp.]|uniref:Stk1 family PASTA domain-containing Ser/Thr kinase n=1 Tax=Lapillicoccus sp. TaxID=1909287 RepID=UPI0032631910
MASSVSASSTPVVGRLLDGRYRVLSHIADGGMATVYLAIDERLEREVAVKVMRENLARDETFVSRFRREARSAAQLSHPHVVAVFDQGEDDGHMFLAMEYVPGRTLRDVLTAEGPLTPRAALDIFDPILQAVAAAHDGGLIHRDVKPENVILRDDGFVKVADFGLARAVTAATTTNAAGTLLGTVAYLSPEQVERGIADARSDVYAAGLVLFEMLTGRKAFDGDSPIHVAYQHVHGTVPVPSDLVDTVPPELDQLVALATARDPDKRPANAGDYLVEVRRSRQQMTPAELDARPQTEPRRVAAAAPTRVSPQVAPTSVVPVVPMVARTEPEAYGRGSPTTPPPRPARRRRRLRPVLVPLLLALLVAGGGGTLWWFSAGPGAMTVVPNVVSASSAVAEGALQEADLRASLTQEYDEAVPTGQVITADPGAGARVRKLSAVSVVVSRGPERYAAPTLVGTPADAAAATLAAVNLTAGARSEEFSETVAAGTVTKQDPAPGASLKPDAPVAFTVSKGRQPITVPTVTNKTTADATTALTNAGLTVTQGGQVNSDDVPAGTVVSQDPSTGTLFKGDAVAIVVSKGPVLVAVPATIGKQRDQAAQLLQAAGFKVAYDNVLGGFFNTVRASDPAVGSMVRKGSTITLTIV